MSETVLHFNGINGLTGKPLTPARTTQQLLQWIKRADDNESDAVKGATQATYAARIVNLAGGVRGLIISANAYDLASAKWGVIYHPGTPQKVRDKVQPLLEKRGGRIVMYDPEKDGNDALAFRGRFDQGPGMVNPKHLPYYLMIVASPDQISYKFQYSLDAQHAVGRLYFDTPDEYESYVTRLLAYEAAPKRQRRAVFFAPQNDVDRATFLSANYLAEPLVKALQTSAVLQQPFQFDFITGAAAKRDTLLEALTRAHDQPALVFTATHGLGYDCGHPQQAACQGALLCGEWTEPVDSAPAAAIPASACLSGENITSAHACDGLLVFAFGCYTAGTPQVDDFSHLKDKPPQELAPQPLVSYLPQRLLAQGALAFIGHVDQVWDYSFMLKGVGQDIDTFQSALEGVLRGDPIGYAFEAFNQRWLDLAQYVTQRNEQSLLTRHLKGYPVDLDQLVYYWTAHNDARAYVIFGDPFVRLQPDRLSAA
jgi:hypothetical protein